jgi:hypothetical protein
MIYHAQPYGIKVRFAFTERMARYLFRRFKAEWIDGCAGLTAWADDGSIILVVLDGKRATLVHECTHAALFVLEHVGIDPFASNGEPMAYLLDSMYTACENGLQRDGKGR